MRRHGSIFMLFVRSSLYKVLLVLAAMVLAEGVLFVTTLNGYLETEAQNMTGAYALHSLVEDARLAWVFLAAFLLITLVLCLFGCDFNGKLEYTIQRLGVSPVGIFFWQAGCNALMYVLLWLVQLYTVFGFCMYYLQVADPSWATSQTLFLEVHRSEFLFSLFPAEDVGSWMINVFLLILLGISTARVPHCQRRRKLPVAIFVVLLLSCSTFLRGMGRFDVYLYTVLIGIPAILMTVVCVHMAEPGLDEE